MTVLSTFTLPIDSSKMRWKEPYVTAGLNEKVLGQLPKGVFAGFIVEPNGAWGVDLKVDPVLGFSAANIVDTTTRKYCVTVLHTATIGVDLGTLPSLPRTVYITLDAQYLLGVDSPPQVKVVDDAELTTNPNLVLLAKVDVPGVSPVLASHINTGYRLHSGDSVTQESKASFNLVNNPGFESGTTAGWFNDGGFTTFTATNAVSWNGNYSLEVARTVAGTANATTGPMPVVPDQTYRVAARLRTIAGLTGNGAKLQVGWFNALDVQIGSWTDVETAITSPTTSPPFALRKGVVTAPADAVNARLRIHYDAASGFLFVDDVEFSSPEPSAVMQTALFGGAGSVADKFHGHTSGGSTYAAGPAWADGTTNPASVVQAQLDKIVTDLAGTVSGSGGAAKVGYTPTTPVDITLGTPGSTAHVEKALNELDDLKAGINQPNTFTKNNTFNNAVANTTAITAYGNGTGAGVVGQGGDTGSGGSGVVGIGRINAITAHGVVGKPNNPNNPTMTGGPFGVVGLGGDAGGYGHGVVGIGDSASGGSGVVGVDWPTTPIPDASQAAGVIGAGALGNPGMYAFGGADGTFDTGAGLFAQGGAAGACGVRASAGGIATSIQAGVYGSGGNGIGAGVEGHGGFGGSSYGVVGQGNGSGTTGAGVYGHGQGVQAPGVYGEGYDSGVITTSGIGVVGLGFGDRPGVSGTGGAVGGGGPGVRGLAGPLTGAPGVFGVGSNGSQTVPGGAVGVYGAGGGNGGTGGQFVAGAGFAGIGVVGTGSTSGGVGGKFTRGDGSTSSPAIDTRGSIDFSNSTDPAVAHNVLTKALIPKAYAFWNSNSTSLLDSVNVTSVAPHTSTGGGDFNYILVTMSQPMGANYCIIPGMAWGALRQIHYEIVSSTQFKLHLYQEGIGEFNPNSAAFPVSFVVFGHQP